jgi:hypothetical protein
MSHRLIWCLPLILALAGCGGQSDAPPLGALTVASYASAAQADSVEVPELVTTLREVDAEDFMTAFETQRAYSYSRYRRTEQFSEDGLLSAFAEYTLELRPSAPPTLTAADSAGAFDYGYFTRFVSNTLTDLDPVDLSAYVLPADPPYLQDRHLGAYAYRALGDTLLWDRQARRIEVEAKPVEGDGYNIRRVRYMIDKQTSQLLAVELDRIDLALLYREESSFFLHVRPTRSGESVPYASRFYTSVWMPFREVKRIGTVSTYYDYRRAGDADLWAQR